MRGFLPTTTCPLVRSRLSVVLLVITLRVTRPSEPTRRWMPTRLARRVVPSSWPRPPTGKEELAREELGQEASATREGSEYTAKLSKNQKRLKAKLALAASQAEGNPARAPAQGTGSQGDLSKQLAEVKSALAAFKGKGKAKGGGGKGKVKSKGTPS